MRTAPAGYPDARRREPLWDRVDRNQIKLAAYVFVFVLSAVVSFDLLVLPLAYGAALFVAGLLGWEELQFVLSHPGLIWVGFSAVMAAVALAWALYALSRSENWLARQLDAALAPMGEELPTKMALKDMAIAAGQPVAPALFVIEARTVNAFVFSAHRRRAIVGVTRGMLDKLSIDEQRAVFANLVARLVAGDTVVATGVTAMLLPMYAWRDYRLRKQHELLDTPSGFSREVAESASLWGMAGPLALFGFAFVILGELLVGGHRGKQLRLAEKADAEGMLLLKDPRAMLAALEKSVHYDNLVRSAGEAFAGLFYCWTGLSTNDEQDPEWRRVARLREVLGVEGVVVAQPDRSADVIAVAPAAPRLD